MKKIDRIVSSLISVFGAYFIIPILIERIGGIRLWCPTMVTLGKWRTQWQIVWGYIYNYALACVYVCILVYIVIKVCLYIKESIKVLQG